MRLNYRGCPYDTEPSNLMSRQSDAPVQAQFRGVSYQVSCPSRAIGLQPPVLLQFRGTSYIRE